MSSTTGRGATSGGSSTGAKGNESKSSKKFSALNINNLYQGKSSGTAPKQAAPKYGLQLLGKVSVTRRMPPPPTLPSVKSEKASSTAPVNSSTTVSNSTVSNPGWASGTYRESQEEASGQTTNLCNSSQQSERQTSSQAAPSGANVSAAVTEGHSGQKSWNAAATSIDTKSAQFFPQEFPKLSGESSGQQAQSESSQKQKPLEAYGPGPCLRPQTEGSWSRGTQGNLQQSHGNAASGTSTSATSTSSSTVTTTNAEASKQPASAPRAFPSTSAGGPAPVSHPQGPMLPNATFQRPQMGPIPPFRLVNPYIGMMPFAIPQAGQANSGSHQRHHFAEQRTNKSSGEAYRPRPSATIISEKDLKSFDEIVDSQDGWMEPKIDYNAKLQFSDEEDEDQSKPAIVKRSSNKDDKERFDRDREREQERGDREGRKEPELKPVVLRKLDEKDRSVNPNDSTGNRRRHDLPYHDSDQDERRRLRNIPPNRQDYGGQPRGPPDHRGGRSYPGYQPSRSHADEDELWRKRQAARSGGGQDLSDRGRHIREEEERKPIERPKFEKTQHESNERGPLSSEPMRNTDRSLPSQIKDRGAYDRERQSNVPAGNQTAVVKPNIKNLPPRLQKQQQEMIMRQQHDQNRNPPWQPGEHRGNDGGELHSTRIDVKRSISNDETSPRNLNKAGGDAQHGSTDRSRSSGLQEPREGGPILKPVVPPNKSGPPPPGFRPPIKSGSSADLKGARDQMERLSLSSRDHYRKGEPSNEAERPYTRSQDAADRRDSVLAQKSQSQHGQSIPSSKEDNASLSRRDQPISNDKAPSNEEVKPLGEKRNQTQSDSNERKGEDDSKLSNESKNIPSRISESPNRSREEKERNGSEFGKIEGRSNDRSKENSSKDSQRAHEPELKPVTKPLRSDHDNYRGSYGPHGERDRRTYGRSKVFQRGGYSGYNQSGPRYLQRGPREYERDRDRGYYPSNREEPTHMRKRGSGRNLSSKHSSDSEDEDKLFEEKRKVSQSTANKPASSSIDNKSGEQLSSSKQSENKLLSSSHASNSASASSKECQPSESKEKSQIDSSLKKSDSSSSANIEKDAKQAALSSAGSKNEASQHQSEKSIPFSRTIIRQYGPSNYGPPPCKAAFGSAASSQDSGSDSRKSSSPFQSSDQGTSKQTLDNKTESQPAGPQPGNQRLTDSRPGNNEQQKYTSPLASNQKSRADISNHQPIIHPESRNEEKSSTTVASPGLNGPITSSSTPPITLSDNESRENSRSTLHRPNAIAPNFVAPANKAGTIPSMSFTPSESKKTMPQDMSRSQIGRDRRRDSPHQFENKFGNVIQQPLSRQTPQSNIGDNRMPQIHPSLSISGAGNTMFQPDRPHSHDGGLYGLPSGHNAVHGVGTAPSMPASGHAPNQMTHGSAVGDGRPYRAPQPPNPVQQQPLQWMMPQIPQPMMTGQPMSWDSWYKQPQRMESNFPGSMMQSNQDKSTGWDNRSPPLSMSQNSLPQNPLQTIQNHFLMMSNSGSLQRGMTANPSQNNPQPHNVLGHSQHSQHGPTATQAMYGGNMPPNMANLYGNSMAGQAQTNRMTPGSVQGPNAHSLYGGSGMAQNRAQSSHPQANAAASVGNLLMYNNLSNNSMGNRVLAGHVGAPPNPALQNQMQMTLANHQQRQVGPSQPMAHHYGHETLAAMNDTLSNMKLN